MRILLVHKYARVLSGADAHCLALTRYLRERGHEVRWLSTAHPENVETEGVFVAPTYSREGGRTRPAAGVATRALWNPDAAAGMRSLLESFHPDVVHCHKLYPQLSVAPVVVAADRGLPVVQMAHDYEFVSWNERSPDPSAPPYGGLASRALLRALFGVRRRVHVRRVVRFVVASEFVARAHLRAGIESRVIPLFVEEDEQRRSDGRDGVVFVSRLLERKGAADVAICARLLPPDVRITAVGDGPLEPMLRDAGVACTGRVSRAEARAASASARIAICPSTWAEPAGLSALEAMVAGTPVIAYESGGLAEYVHEAGGIVVPADPRRLAEVIADLYGDAERRTAIGSAQQSHVRARHAPDAYLDALLETFAQARGTVVGSAPTQRGAALPPPVERCTDG